MRFIIFIVGCNLIATCCYADDPPTSLWTRLIGTNEIDDGEGLAVDRCGNIFSAGSTFGSLQQQNQGKADAVVLSLSPTGKDRWRCQWGTALDERLRDVAVTATGHVIACGYGLNSAQGFVRKFNNSGAVCWEVPLPEIPKPRRIVVDRFGAAYVVGMDTHYAVLTRISSSGRICWTQRIDGGALTLTVATDHCFNVYVAGIIGGQGQVAKFDTSGNLCWLTSLDNEAQTLRDVAVDHCGRIVVIGNRTRNLDPFIQRLMPDGTFHSSASLGHVGPLRLWRLAIDRGGAIYVAGSNGEPGELFLAKIDDSLRDKWWHWLSEGRGFVKGLDVDRCGQILVSGHVDRSIHGQPHSGMRDIFVMKLKP